MAYDQHTADILRLNEFLRTEIRAAMNELGVPGEGYPAPVARAYYILRAALAATEAGTSVHVHTADCYGNYNDFDALTCGRDS